MKLKIDEYYDTHKNSLEITRARQLDAIQLMRKKQIKSKKHNDF